MCGIVGALLASGGVRIEEAVACLEHRGPDQAAVWREGPTHLGFRRLAIIDLSELGHQPMSSPDGRYVIVFNGEIYNFQELRAGLEAKGEKFRGHSDTEVLLRLFTRDGLEGCLGKLRGMFAFAVWDRAVRRLFIARDQLGVKPLYYAALPHGFLFASELKALTVCPDVARDIDVGSVANHLAFVWSSSASTMLKSVRKLRPGHCAWIDANARLTIERYYEIPLPPPFSVTTNGLNAFGDNAGVGNGTGTGSRPDLVGNPKSGFSANQDPSERGPLAYNPAAYALPTGLTFGTVGRNTLTLPGRLNFDFGLFKKFPINEKTGFDFRWETFNLFNHTQFNQVNADFGPSDFLHLTNTHDGRRMQLGLRFYF